MDDIRKIKARMREVSSGDYDLLSSLTGFSKRTTRRYESPNNHHLPSFEAFVKTSREMGFSLDFLAHGPDLSHLPGTEEWQRRSSLWAQHLTPEQQKEVIGHVAAVVSIVGEAAAKNPELTKG